MASRERFVWFIDANVLAHWVLASCVLERLFELRGIERRFLEIYVNRYEASIRFVDRILECDLVGHEFYVSLLALNEVFAAVKDEVNAVLLFEKGIPISMWRDPSVIPEIDEGLAWEIYEATSNCIDRILGGGAVHVVEEVLPAKFKEYYDVFASLVLVLGVRTHDAMLLTDAIVHGADFFVTTDQRLIKRAKRRVKEEYNLSIVAPHEALSKLKEV